MPDYKNPLPAPTDPGWRPAGPGQVYLYGVPVLRISGSKSGIPDRYFIYEPEPISPLPTRAYSVIRVTWKPSPDDATEVTEFVLRDQRWWACGGVENYDPWDPDLLEQRITGWAPLAVPAPDEHDRYAEQQRDAALKAVVRRETAKAVIERMHALWLHNSSWLDVMKMAREEFEVEGR